MAIIAGPYGSMARGGPLTTIAPQYIPNVGTAAADPGAFDNLLNFFRKGAGSVDDALKGAGTSVSNAVAGAGGAKAVAGKIAGKYLPIAGAGLSVLQGDVGGALGGLGGMAVGSLLGPVGALGGSVVGGMLGTAAQKGIGGLLQNVPGAVGNIARTTMAQGTSPNVIPGTGGKSIESMSMDEIRELVRLQPQLAEQLEGVNNRTRDAELNRTMQLNQQTGQLTGALNQQRYMAQLAGGAQSEAGATTRSILTAQNPYAASAFSYRG
jgi:hypothetical protein